MPEKIEGDLYYFNCSHNQVSHYFKRFGKDAMIIAPIGLAYMMKKYYHKANREYSEFLKTKTPRFELDPKKTN